MQETAEEYYEERTAAVSYTHLVRHFPAFQLIHNNRHICFMSHYKINLSLNVLCPSAYICLQNLFKGLETLWRIVEVRNCLCQILNRVLLQKTLEMTESLCALIKIFFSLNDVIGCLLYTSRCV